MPLRGLGFVALVTAAAYLFTPATAGGHDAGCFGFNTRFATPALALGLILLPLAFAADEARATALRARACRHARAHRASLARARAARWRLVLVGAACLSPDTLRLPASASRSIALVLVVAAGFRHEQQVYTHRLYDAGAFNDPVAPIAHRLQDVHDARIAVVGLAENYPLYGARSLESSRVSGPS